MGVRVRTPYRELHTTTLVGIYYCNRGDLVWLSEDGQSSWCTRVITTFPTSPLTQPSPAATGATPVASSVTSAAIAAVAAARAAGLANLTSNSAVAQHHAHNAAVAHAAVAAQQQQQQTQPQVTTHATSVVSTGNNPSAVVTGTPQVAATVNGRKRRMSSSNSGNNNSSPSYPRMENSSNLSQSMDSVNTASGEEEVRTLFVSGLPMDTKPRELYLLFRAYEGYEGSLLKVTSKNGKTSSVSLSENSRNELMNDIITTYLFKILKYIFLKKSFNSFSACWFCYI